MDCKLRAKNCGGCPMLGMDYAAQLKQKEETVKKLLGRFGPVEHIRGMETPYHYRNKVISTFTTGWGGKLTSGIYAANSHKVLPVESCLLQDEVLDKTMLAVRAAAGTCHYQPFNEDKGTGLLRHCLLRRGVMTGQVMVVLATAQPVLPGAKNFVKALLTEAGKQGVAITTIVQNANNRRTSWLLGDREQTLYGPGFIRDTLCGMSFRISPRSFYQINPAQTEVLYRRAIEAAGLTGKERVLDAYCGIGTISLFLAKAVPNGQVTGVEIFPEAIENAKKNAVLNGISNTSFYCGAAEDVVTDMVAKRRTPSKEGTNGALADVVVVDPPRKGCDAKLLDTIVTMNPEKIVYVSCDPATLARDVKVLGEKGYEVKKVRACDMFPQGGHVETVVKLSLKKDTPKIEVTMEPHEESNYTTEEKITYQKIKAYILEKYGFKVSSLYIAQIKDKCGLGKERTGNNWKKNDKSKEPQCTPEKEEAIRDAFKNFNII